VICGSTASRCGGFAVPRAAASAALPLPVRKASGFPWGLQLFWRLRRPRRSLSLFEGRRKARGFPHGRRQSRI